MENNYGQNSCIMVTAIDDETGGTTLSYIPLSLDVSVVDYLIDKGECKNKTVCMFDIDQTEEDFWKAMWENLKEQCEWD